MMNYKDLLDYCREFNTDNWFEFMRLWLCHGEAPQRWHIYLELRLLARDSNVTCLEQAIDKMLQLYQRVKQREQSTREHIQTLREASQVCGRCQDYNGTY